MNMSEKNREHVSAVDVRKPDFQYNRDSELLDLKTSSFRGESGKIHRGFLFTVAGAIALLGIGFLFLVGLRAKESSDFLETRGAAIGQNVSASLEELGAFNPEGARPFLEENMRVLGESGAGRGSFSDIVGSVIPLIRDAGSMTRTVLELNTNLLELAELLSDLRDNGFSYFMNEEASLIDALAAARDRADAVVRESQEIKNAATRLRKTSSWFSGLDQVAGDPYLAFGFDVLSMRETLDGLVRALDTDVEERFVIFFADEAKGYRPGSGALGGFMNVYFQDGKATRIVSGTIPKGGLVDATTPQPAELGEGGSWSFSDASWFFDYPESARAALHFIETADPVDAAPIAGVATLSSRAMRELQVIAGVEGTEQSEKLFQMLASLDSAKRRELAELVGTLLADRDLLLVSDRDELSAFLGNAQLDGASFKAPSDFWGWYMGLAYGDVRGAEDSPLSGQFVSGKVDIDGNGSALVDLSIEHRFREGSTVKRGTREAFVQVFTVPGTELISISGNNGSARSAGKQLGAHVDDEQVLRRFEAKKVFLKPFNVWTGNIFGSTMFEMFADITKKGAGTMQMRYQTPLRPGAGAMTDGRQFNVVLERQAGVPTSMQIRIFAPFGYRWKESEAASFLYETDSAPGRVSFPLTLEKD